MQLLLDLRSCVRSYLGNEINVCEFGCVCVCQVLGEEKYLHGSVYTPKEKRYSCSFKDNIKINLKVIEYDGDH
jgi:hypothetical protein